MARDNAGPGRSLLQPIATFVGELRDDIRAAPLWQIGLLVFSVALAGLFITMVGLALTDGDDDAGRYGVSAGDAPKHDSGGDVRSGEAGPLTPNAPGVAGDEENREDCDAIGAEGAFNNTEREWALANCPELSADFVAADDNPDDADPGDTSGGGPASGSPGNVAGPGPAAPTAPPAAGTPVPPAPTSPPASTFGAGDAIALTIGYYATAPAGHYDIDPSACTATGAGGSWNVSCVGRLAGCALAECVEVVNACVSASTRAVAPGSC